MGLHLAEPNPSDKEGGGQDQDGDEDAPHASMNLLNVEKVDTKMKDGRKVVRLWIDEKKKVERRQAPKDGDQDDASIDKWE